MSDSERLARLERLVAALFEEINNLVEYRLSYPTWPEMHHLVKEIDDAKRSTTAKGDVVK